ncbi:MAG: hypothetical protein OXD29_01815, partial [Roseovarius sp.]|nr:hypothetical protein [Roseovarius sp.]
RNAPSAGFGSGLRGGEGARRTRRLAMRGLWAGAVRDRQDMAALGGCTGDVPQGGGSSPLRLPCRGHAQPRCR